MKSGNRGVTSAASEHTMTSNTRSTIIETMVAAAKEVTVTQARSGCWNHEVFEQKKMEAALTALEASGMAVVDATLIAEARGLLRAHAAAIGMTGAVREFLAKTSPATPTEDAT